MKRTCILGNKERAAAPTSYGDCRIADEALRLGQDLCLATAPCQPMRKHPTAICILLICSFAVGFLLASRVLAADDLGAALHAYSNGQFTEAATIAEAVGGSRGYALAAESLTIHARYNAAEAEKKDILERAVDFAAQAVKLNPGSASAQLQLARSVGHYGSVISKLDAVSQNIATRVRDRIEIALELDPLSAQARVSLGRWHAELINRAGPLLARVLYKARRKDAVQFLRSAYELEPRSKEIALNYALGLLALNRNKYRDEVRSLLEQSIAIPAINAYEKLLHEHAIERLSEVNIDSK